MGKIEKKLRSVKSNNQDEEEQEHELKTPNVLSSDNEEAYKDLSLKIVDKAKLRACSTGRSNLFLDESYNEGMVNLSSSLEAEVLTDLEGYTEKKRKKVNNRKIETPDNVGGGAMTEEVAETYKSLETGTLLEMNPVEKSDNMVLRKLLRGPRYFDPPDSSWGSCYNCGEAGHTIANCTSAKRKKPCFVCGSLEHNVKQCKNGKDCFICKKSGHRAKDCPEKSAGLSQNAKICLKCGDSGHDMFSCKHVYSTDDLKDIQCYICKCFGHLCCVNYTGAGPRELSCYRCGWLGHTGLACTGKHGETAGVGTPSSCYRCGEEGHFARECASSRKISKRNRDSSNPKHSCREENRNHNEVRSAPHDLGKARKKKKTQYGGVMSSSKSKQRGGWTNEDLYAGVASSSKSKNRGGWITEDPGDFSHGHYRPNLRSPGTPTDRSNKFHNYSAGGGRKLHFGNSPSSNGSATHYQHRFSIKIRQLK